MHLRSWSQGDLFVFGKEKKEIEKTPLVPKETVQEVQNERKQNQ